MSRDPQDTLIVVGGRPVTAVDAEQIRATARRIVDATDRLRAATAQCALARAALERMRWSPPPLGQDDPGWPARVRWALALADGAAVTLAARVDRCAVLSDRLLRAAGFYEEAESLAEQIVGAGVGALGAGVGLPVSAVAFSPLTVWPARIGTEGWDLAREHGLLPGGGDDPEEPAGREASARTADSEGSGGPDDGGLPGAMLRAGAPYVDESVAGAAFGVALGAPQYSGLDLSVTGAARVLSRVLDAVLGRRDVAILPVRSGDFAVGLPDWHDRPLARIDDALVAVADLYPGGSHIPGRTPPGTPDATIAVQQVTQADGSISWTVLIPGTQELLSDTNTFDGATDVDLMAQDQVADVAAGVTAALADAGAAPDEPVVLVGHSLGGIAATSLAVLPAFRDRHRVAGVVTAGAPTATFTTPRGVPVLHLENPEGIVSAVDGRSTAENPGTADRVTLGRSLADSADPLDRAASGSITAAHSVATHRRTLRAAERLGSVQVAGVSGRIEAHLDGRSAETRYYQVRRDARTGE